jgi:integrase
MGKRRNGEGQIRQRQDGRWEARFRYLDPMTGEDKRHSVYAGSQRKVRDLMRIALDRLTMGSPVKDATFTVADWTQRWLQTGLLASSRRASTIELYRNLGRHISAPPLGNKRLDKLRPSDIDQWVLDMRSRPGRLNGTMMSPSTVQRAFTVLRVILDAAVRDGHLARNPAKTVPLPKVPYIEQRFLEPSQIRDLLAAAEVSRLGVILDVIATTGLRQGEALALQWADVDFEDATLRVRGTLTKANGRLIVSEPKTERSRRVLPLTPTLAARLAEHRKTQVAERLLAGDLWNDNDFVFATELGKPIDPRNLLRTLTRAAKAAGIAGRVNLHSLRHSAATNMLDAGVSIRAVADLLGHADIRMTGKIYAHKTDVAASRAMEVLSQALQAN